MVPPAKTPTGDCGGWKDNDIIALLEKEEYLEEVVWKGFRMWHLIFLSMAALLSLTILLCCCVKFRIPRTKQEIEADYIRRKILRKFRKRLKAIQNQELDEMDLKKALDKIRAEFKSDSESLAQSEGFSAATISSIPGVGAQGSTYRRASQIQIDISLEELRAHSLGIRARMALALSRLCGRSKVSQSDKVALTVAADGETQLMVPEATFSGKKSGTAASTSKSATAEVKKSEGKLKTPKTDKKKDDKGDKGGKSTQPPEPVAGQSSSVKSKENKQKEKEEKDKKKVEKEKEEKEKKKVEKEKEKVEKSKLKIENEKAKKGKEKVDKPDVKEKGGKSKENTKALKDEPKVK